MEVITSKESRTFRDLLKLTQRKYREREGLFIAEGPNIVEEAVSQESVEVVSVFARDGSGYETLTDGTIVLSGNLFDRVSDQVTSRGVIAVLREPDRNRSREMLEEAGNIIVLDRVQDPGNIGTIIRTAEGAGIGAAAVIKGTCDPYSPKVVRACAGSILRMPMMFFDSAEDFIEAAKDTGFRIAVTDVVNGVSYYDAGLSDKEKTALVIGNEGQGVSDTFREAADILVNIPMKGKVESLNAGVAAALLMYEMARPHVE